MHPLKVRPYILFHGETRMQNDFLFLNYGNSGKISPWEVFLYGMNANIAMQHPKLFIFNPKYRKFQADADPSTWLRSTHIMYGWIG